MFLGVKVDANMTFFVTIVIVSTKLIFLALIVHIFSVTVSVRQSPGGKMG